MIALTRRRTAIPKAFRQPGLAKSAAKLMDIYYSSPGGPYDFDSKAWKPAKAALKKESAGKCAYCEAPTDVVAHGDVEHFRPKSNYWWLALTFDNYLYSCQLCNQTYKGDKFPVAGVRLAGPVLPPAPLPPTDPRHGGVIASLILDASALTDADILGLWASEDADLPHPCFDNPESLFAYEADHANQEVWVRSAGGARADRAMAAADDCLGINREELRRERFVNYATLAAFKAILDTAPPADARAIAIAEVRRMQRAAEPFAGMRRYFARTWGLPGPL